MSLLCPSCRAPLKADSKWCPSCNFTGSTTVELFPGSPPPLLPILDAMGIWNDSDIQKIEAARESLRKRFPQLHWRVCTVGLPPETPLPVFGFWLLNACPLLENETSEDRAWTILLLIDVESGQAAAIPGYAAETCLADEEWQKALDAMAGPWQSGKTADAVVEFFKNSRSRLDESWKRNGSRTNR
ncbi:MAG: hypothetical protein ABI162_03095 [Luteolibacter sp.]